MIEVTVAEFIKNPSHVQSLAQKEPVIVGDGDNKQVLMDYDEYQKSIGEDVNKPPMTGREFLAEMAEGMTDEQLELLASTDMEFDMSFSGAN